VLSDVEAPLGAHCHDQPSDRVLVLGGYQPASPPTHALKNLSIDSLESRRNSIQASQNMKQNISKSENTAGRGGGGGGTFCGSKKDRTGFPLVYAVSIEFPTSCMNAFPSCKK
jgi:hypothetical protein